MITLPQKFEHRMKELLQEEFPEFLRGFEEERHGGVRFNSLKVSKEEWERIAPFATLQVPWIHNGYYYSLNDQPAKHPFYFAEGTVTVDGRLCVSAEFSFAITGA